MKRTDENDDNDIDVFQFDNPNKNRVFIYQFESIHKLQKIFDDSIIQNNKIELVILDECT